MHEPFWLPPSLQPPSSPTVPLLTITPVQLTYLSVLTPRPSHLRYKFWGLKSKPILYPLTVGTPHTFPSAVSLSMLLRYLQDMKVLECEICDRVGVGVVKGWVNFGVLDGWRGEGWECGVELRRGAARVGEMRVRVQIEMVGNPALKEQDGQGDQGRGQWDTPVEKKVQPVMTKQHSHQQTVPIPKHRNEDLQPYHRMPTPNFPITTPPNQSLPSHHHTHQHLHPDPYQLQESTVPLQPRPPATHPKTQLIPAFEPCICSSINPNKHQLQKLKLREDLQLFFNHPQPTHSTSSYTLQFLNWNPLTKSKEEPTPAVKVTVPCLEHASTYTNEYVLATGRGRVEVVIHEGDQLKLKKYLGEAAVVVEVAGCRGAIPMFKVVASRGSVCGVGVYESRGKQETLRGHYLLRLVAQAQVQNATTVPKPVQQLAPLPPAPSPPLQYYWLYLRQFHFLQPQHHPRANLYIKIPQAASYTTKTLWHSSAPTFNQIITVPFRDQEQIVLEVWDRQQAERLVGRAGVRAGLDGGEVAVRDGFGRVQGWLGVWGGRGGLEAATRWVNLHMGGRGEGQARGQREEQQKREHESRSSKSSEQQKEEASERHDSSLSHSHPPHKQQQPSVDPRHSDSEPSFSSLPLPSSPLSPLQLHTHTFTQYLRHNNDWLHTYKSPVLSIAQMCYLLKPYIESMDVARFCSFYMESEGGIGLEGIRDSYEAFLVYYEIGVSDRDRAIKAMLEDMQNEGISINYLEEILAGRHGDRLWRDMKERLPAQTVESVRYYYQAQPVEHLCDQLRRFEVYETTRGTQIAGELLAEQVAREVGQILQVDRRQPDFVDVVKSAGLELSVFERLAVFGELEPRRKAGTGMTKSPTFGYLNTDRMREQERRNPSLDIMAIENSSLAMFSQKFGNPKVSPISQKQYQSSTLPTITITFSNTIAPAQQLCVNGQKFQFEDGVVEAVEVQIRREPKYEGYVRMGDQEYEFEGAAGEWISLVDEQGRYGGCLIFQ